MQISRNQKFRPRFYQICHLIEKSKLAQPSRRITLKSSTERCFKARRVIKPASDERQKQIKTNIARPTKTDAIELETGGKPSTRLPPGGLVEPRGKNIYLVQNPDIERRKAPENDNLAMHDSEKSKIIPA